MKKAVISADEDCISKEEFWKMHDADDHQLDVKIAIKANPGVAFTMFNYTTDDM